MQSNLARFGGLLCMGAFAALPLCAAGAAPGDVSVAQQPGLPPATASPSAEATPGTPPTTAPQPVASAEPSLAPSAQPSPVVSPAASSVPAAATPPAAVPPAGGLRPEAFAQLSILPVEAVNNYLAHGVQAFAAPTLALGATYPALRLAIAGEFQVETFAHATANVPANGGGTIFLPAELKHTYLQDGRLDFRLTDSGIYLGVGGIYRASSYGYPELTAFGFGIEALPDLHAADSVYGRAFFFPNVNNEDPPAPRAIRLSTVRWEIGEAHRLGHSEGYFTFALDASRYYDLSEHPRNVPSGDDTRIGPSVGFLIKL